MTEKQAMIKLVGRIATLTRPTHTGTETIVGAIKTPLVIEETEGAEVVTHITLTGMVTTETVKGLPHPLVAERAITLEMIPIESVRLL